MAPTCASEGQLDVVVFGADLDYPPFQFRDRAGVPAGYDVDVFRALTENAGFQGEVRFDNWTRVKEQLEVGELDVVPMFVTPERSGRFLFSENLLSRYHLVFGRRDSPPVSQLEELAGRRVAVQRGSPSEQALLELGTAELVFLPSEQEAVRAVAAGAVDAALVPGFIGRITIHRHRLDEVVALSPPLLPLDYAFAISPRRPDLVAVVDAGLAELRARGELDRIHQRWLANLVPPKEVFRAGLRRAMWISGPLIFFGFLFLVWWRAARRRAVVARKEAVVEEALRREAEARADHLAFHDSQTGLPNRNALEACLDAELARAVGSRRPLALVVLKLLDLGMIRHVAGHTTAESAVDVLSRRLQECAGRGRVFRLSATQFALLLDLELGDSVPATRLHELANLVGRRMNAGDLPLELNFRLGMALAPAHADQGGALLRAAEMALAVADETQVPAALYDAAMEPDPRNLTLMAELRQAIADDRIGYAIQPKLDLAERKVVGGELLVRWQHPVHGPLSPGMFIPLAEKTGAIRDLTAHLIGKAVRHLEAWSKRRPELVLAVNVSGNDLADELMVESVAARCRAVGSRLVLEVTETEVMRAPDRVLAGVERLRAAGVRISLDDFGTGYSSLTYLKRLEPDEVKIDRSFVSGLIASPGDQAIVRLCLQLAHEMGAAVTAEGIESEETLAWLRDHGCEFGQGFGIGRPMSVDQFLCLGTEVANDFSLSARTP